MKLICQINPRRNATTRHVLITFKSGSVGFESVSIRFKSNNNLFEPGFTLLKMNKKVHLTLATSELVDISTAREVLGA
jgi:hypothetical protein